MQYKKLLILLAAGTCLSISAAELKNLDDVDYSLRVVTDDSSEDIVIKAGQTLTNICEECTIYLDGSEEPFDVYQGDVIVIKNGELDFSSE